jgi:polar amino acid transport system substrate-binding protein
MPTGNRLRDRIRLLCFAVSDSRWFEEVASMSLIVPRLGSSLAIVAAVVLALAGCGGGGKKSSTAANVPAAGENAKIAAEVPAAIRKKGTLTVAADATYPPNEFIQGGRVVGMDADLAKALGQVMGLKVKVVNVTFDAIIPGLAAKKYDLGMSSFTDTKEREKTVDFVSYYTVFTSFFVKAHGGPKINTIADLCGHKVAVEKGTTQQDDATKQGKKCKSAGKPAVTVLVFPDQNGVNLALSSGRAEVDMADTPVADYVVGKSNGQFKLAGSHYGPFPYGIAIPKGTGLDKPILDALKDLISKGSYQAILKRWGIQEGAIKSPGINVAKG